MIRICIHCGKKYTCIPGSEAEKDGLCGICFRIEKATTIQTTTKIINNFNQHKEAPSQPITSSQTISLTPIAVSTQKYEERPLTYYMNLLTKFDVSDCLTFEEVKKKFPDRDPAFLRKLIHLKGLKISGNGMLEGGTEKVTEPPSTPSASEREGQTPRTILSDDFRLLI